MTVARRGPLATIAAVTAGVVVALATITGCAPTAEPEATASATLTSEQADRLAVTRFRNFDAGIRTIAVTLDDAVSGSLTLDGWFDFSAGAGYAEARDADGASLGLVWWTHEAIAVREIPADELVVPVPTDGWASAQLDPSATALANALALVASLGADRPENPQLLAQSDARFLREDELGGSAVTVFLGPSADDGAPTPEAARASYWVDATGLLLRFENPSTGSGSGGMTVDFTTASTAAVVPLVAPGTP